MAKHAAGPGHPAFPVPDADRDHHAKHRKPDRTEKPGRPKLTLLLTGAINPKQPAAAN